jgi:single-stranded DNA-binding protein
MTIAKLTLMGHLTRDPAKHEKVENLTQFSVAHNIRDKEGKDTAVFFDIDAWEKAGDFVLNNFKKGDGIYLEAEVSQYAWEDEQGNKRRKEKYRLIPFTATWPAGGRKKEESL